MTTREKNRRGPRGTKSRQVVLLFAFGWAADHFGGKRMVILSALA
jgi:hypothetical protein